MTIKSKSVLSILLAGTFLSTTAATADDVFTIKEGSESDYNFTMQEPDGNGNFVTKYYKIKLNSSAFTDSANISWAPAETAGENTIELKLPNNDIEYFKYTYTESENKKVYHSQQNALSGNVNADFINGDGAIKNSANIDAIEGDFINNSTYGAITNTGNIGNITGNFIANKKNTLSGSFSSAGAAIANDKDAVIGNITGNFIGNKGGFESSAIVINRGVIGNITGDFINNIGTLFTNSNNGFSGGRIGNITGNFIGNSANLSDSSGALAGAAIYNEMLSFVGKVTGDFIGNNVTNGAFARAGAILNKGYIGTINGNFIANYAQSTSDFAYGGAIATNGNLVYSLSDGKITITPVEIASNGKEIVFSDNYTKDSRGKIYNAIYVMRLWDYLNEAYGIDPEMPLLAFDTTGGGSIIINDNIDGALTEADDLISPSEDRSSQYNLAFKGDDTIGEDGKTTQYIAVNNDIINAGKVTVENTTLRFGAYQHEDTKALNWDGKGSFAATLNADGTVNHDADAVTSLSLTNAAFDLYNGYQEEVKLAGYSSNNGYLHIDINVNDLTADVLNINGDVEGTTNLLVYANSPKDIRNKGSILFAQSSNDTTGNADSFKVWRVYKSPYLYDIKYTQTAADANKWELSMNDTVNPDASQEPSIPENPDVPNIKPQPTPGDVIEVTPEVVGSQSLPSAALAQNSNLIYNIMNKVSANRLYCPGCGFYDYYWNGKAFHNLWVNPFYTSLNIDAPTKIDADIWGVEAGGDLQHNLNNRLGLFASYRNGDYDMSGDGKHYYSTIGSEIEIDSYLAGLYYRYDKNNWYAFATVYGGMQEANLKTNDGVKSDTDGIEFGGSLEVGYDYALNKTVYVTPSLGVFYSQVNYDDAKDNAGKKVEYNDLSQVELEAGIKLTKSFWYDDGFANIYVKPSIVQTIINGDEITITGLGKVDSMDDDTLGRIELGGRYGLSQALSAYGWANYTFGSDYDATTFGAGLNYVF